ncbi:hypothetical protein [Bradyrhizobium sp. McL0616]|uniref:hypothetical protein n=1 Tax=Bradyrhizobium sp. McL0616 TaxID=3415674 RepID=UPI003CF4DF55
MPRSDKEKMADEALCIQLLAGFDVDTGRSISLAHNSAAERIAREALARIVREKMSGFSGELLALAIDPRTPSTWPVMRPARKVRFEKPGRPSTLMRDKLIVDFIRRMRFNATKKHDMKFFLNAAADKFGIKYSRVHEIWSVYEKLLEAASDK